MTISQKMHPILNSNLRARSGVSQDGCSDNQVSSHRSNPHLGSVVATIVVASALWFAIVLAGQWMSNSSDGLTSAELVEEADAEPGKWK